MARWNRDLCDMHRVEAQHLRDKLANLLGGAETVLEAWDRGDETDFRQAIEEMRADVEAMK